MKKLFCALLSLVMVLSLMAGCGASGDASADAGADEGADAVEPKDYTIRVSMGTNNPYGFLNDDEQPDGFVVDTWNEIAARTGYTVEFVYFDSMDAHYGAIDAGKIEVLGAQVAVTPAIADKYNFTDRYAYNIIRMVSLKDKSYETLADLAGQKICIAPGKLSEFFEGYNAENPDKAIELVTTEGNIYEELDLGRFEAFPMTIMAFEKMEREGKAEPYKMFGEAVITEENVFPVSKDVPAEVLADVNAAIADMLADGTLKGISEKWYYRDVTVPFEFDAE